MKEATVILWNTGYHLSENLNLKCFQDFMSFNFSLSRTNSWHKRRVTYEFLKTLRLNNSEMWDMTQQATGLRSCYLDLLLHPCTTWKSHWKEFNFSFTSAPLSAAVLQEKRPHAWYERMFCNLESGWNQIRLVDNDCIRFYNFTEIRKRAFQRYFREKQYFSACFTIETIILTSVFII